MQITTALRKISSLKKRIWVVQGGQGAGKTYAILQLICNHCFSEENREVYICSAELSKMRITIIKDFLNIMKSLKRFERNRWKDGTYYEFPNGSFIKFIGLDKVDIGKGLRSHIVYVNEVDKTNFETFRELTSRAKRVIVDFNPNKKFFIHDEIIPRPDADFLNLTFRDNECLSEEEKKEILMYYEKGYKDGVEINAYWANKWRVYGLGEIGRVDGCIFQNWETGKFDEILPDAYGMDFGSKDPDAIVRVAIDKKNKLIYVKEILYQNSLGTEDLIKLVKKKVPQGKLIVADSAATRTIQDIAAKGINIKSVSKNKIVEDIKLISGYKLIIDTESKNLIDELLGYVWLDKAGEVPSDKNNHLLDAMRYIVNYLTDKPKLSTHKIIKL